MSPIGRKLLQDTLINPRFWLVLSSTDIDLRIVHKNSLAVFYLLFFPKFKNNSSPAQIKNIHILNFNSHIFRFSTPLKTVKFFPSLKLKNYAKYQPWCGCSDPYKCIPLTSHPFDMKIRSQILRTCIRIKHSHWKLTSLQVYLMKSLPPRIHWAQKTSAT